MPFADKVSSLFFLLLADTADKEQVSALASGFSAPEWRKLFSCALGSGLLPLLYSRLQSFSFPAVPAEIVAENKAVFLFNLRKNILIEKQTLEALELLRSASVRAIPLKGPCLARYLYGDLSWRQASSDVDLLVAPEEKERAGEVLEKSGYSFLPVEAGKEFFYKFRTGIMLEKKSAGEEPVYLDLHWGFRDRFVPAHIKEFSAGSRALPYGDSHILFPQDEDLFLFLGLTVFSDFDFVQPKYLQDIHRLVRLRRDTLDWELIRHRATRLGLGSVVFFSLVLSRLIFKTDIPVDIEERLAPSFLKRRFFFRYLSREPVFFKRNKFSQSYLWRYLISSWLLSASPAGAARIAWNKTFISVDEVVAASRGATATPLALYFGRLFKPFKGQRD